MRDKSSDKKKIRKIFRVVLVLLVSLLLVYAILSAALYYIRKSGKDTKISEDDYLTKSFRDYYEEDYDADILKDEDYLELNREILYSEPSGYEYYISRNNFDSLDASQKFFVEYFDVLVGGEYEKYPNLFAKGYINNPDGFEKNPNRKFTKQRIYDINVTFLGASDNTKNYTYDGKKCAFSFYEVKYSILKNDATFRRDLAERSQRPLIFELVTFLEGENEGKTFIKNLYTKQSIE